MENSNRKSVKTTHLLIMTSRIPEIGSFVFCLQHAMTAIGKATSQQCWRSYTGQIYQIAVPVSLN